MTNALTSVSHIGLKPSRALVPVTPSAATDRDPENEARQAEEIHARASTDKRPHQTSIASFVVQMLANDNGTAVTPDVAAEAYWSMNYRLADLPVGFLIARTV